jgi:hypothetical protein
MAQIVFGEDGAPGFFSQRMSQYNSTWFGMLLTSDSLL